LVLAGLRLRHLPDHAMKTGLGDIERFDSGRVCRFSGRKPRVLTPTAAMPAGVVTNLGALLLVPLARGLRVKALDRWSRRRLRAASLPSCGRRRGVPFP
jgi:hypothetical protein